MRCPNCGSNSITCIVDKNTTSKNFNGFDACCGVILFGWPGLLCGLCDTGTKTNTKTTNICNDCGRRF